MVDQPSLGNFGVTSTLFIQPYERYLPTSFDESLTLLQKVNKIIRVVNQIILLLPEGFSDSLVTDLQNSISALQTQLATDEATLTAMQTDIDDLKNRPISTSKTITNETEFIGHRGHNAIAPENTIPSFQLGIMNGFDSIECDVHFTSDGQPIIMHDDTVDRTTNGTGLVSDMTLLTIRSLDASAGKTFFTGTKVPTFDEYLQIAKGRSKYLYPEIKGVIDVTRDVKTFVDKIKAHYLEENTIVQSFTAPYLAEVRKNSSKVILGYLANTLDVFNLRMDYAEEDGNAVVIVDCNILFDDPTLVEQAFSRGIELITYGTDRSRDLQQLYSYGVRRFICNDKQGVIS